MRDVASNAFGEAEETIMTKTTDCEIQPKTGYPAPFKANSLTWSTMSEVSVKPSIGMSIVPVEPQDPKT